MNFVLKEDPGNWSSPAPEAPPPAVPIPGLEPIPAAPGVMPGVTPSPNPTDPRITVSLTDIPLIEALRYVTGLASLKFKVETHAVLIEPSSVNTDVLVTKEWKVRPNFIPDGADARAWLESVGVKFYSPAASAVYLPGSNRLIMRNSQGQLDLMDSLLEAGAELAPVEPVEPVEPAAPVNDPSHA